MPLAVSLLLAKKGVRQWSCRMKNAQRVAAYSNKMIFLRQLWPTEDKMWQVKKMLLSVLRSGRYNDKLLP